MIISSADSNYCHNLNVAAIFQEVLPYIPSLPVNVLCSPLEKLGLTPLPLNLSWPIECSRSDVLGLPGADHKNPYIRRTFCLNVLLSVGMLPFQSLSLRLWESQIIWRGHVFHTDCWPQISASLWTTPIPSHVSDLSWTSRPIEPNNVVLLTTLRDFFSPLSENTLKISYFVLGSILLRIFW